MTTVERTHRWRAAFAFVLFTSSVGLYIERPLVLLASIIGLAYTAYPLLVPEPTVTLGLSRTVTDETPDYGESVTVTVTVTNTGSRTLADLRLIDGVPSLLTVTDGTARHTATLRPGASTTFQYTVVAKYGSHQFEPATAIVQDISGSIRIQTEVAAETKTAVRDTLECTVDVHDIRLRCQTQQYTGRTPADTGGTGIEFHQTRAYQRGDPVNQIDWKQFARTRNLTTVEFREERRTAVVLCLDARARAVRTKQPNEPHAVAYSVAAATEVLTKLRAQSEQVGVAVFGSEFAWLAPGTGSHHYAQATQLLATHRNARSAQADSPEGMSDKPDQLQQFFAHSGDNIEVILFSPLLDEFGVTAAQHLEVNGHAVTVLSPDVSTDETLGAELAEIERANRVQSLRNSRIPVGDWTPEEPLVWPIHRTETSVR